MPQIQFMPRTHPADPAAPFPLLAFLPEHVRVRELRQLRITDRRLRYEADVEAEPTYDFPAQATVRFGIEQMIILQHQMFPETRRVGIGTQPMCEALPDEFFPTWAPI